MRPYFFKITRAKWSGGMVTAIEHLLSKHDTLSSNPSSIKKEEKKKES
jgi:hypothetical protein